MQICQHNASTCVLRRAHTGIQTNTDLNSLISIEIEIFFTGLACSLRLHRLEFASEVLNPVFF